MPGGGRLDATNRRTSNPRLCLPWIETGASGRVGDVTADRWTYLRRFCGASRPLFEQVVVQSRGRTIREYVESILERQVPDHRTIRAAGPGGAKPDRGPLHKNPAPRARSLT
jgi:hypothetical protein